MSMRKCPGCNRGRIMGGGFIETDHDECQGTGEIPDYTESIEKVRALDPSMTKEQAERIFMDEMTNVIKEEKNGKKRKLTKSVA
jgi:hypothetical protein